MKHYFYLFLHASVCLVAAYIPHKAAAQCNCDDGTPATPITHMVKMDSSALAKVTISFPRFDPSIGTLTCILLRDTTSGVSTTNVHNTAPQDVEYRFRLTVATGLSGPGFTVDDAFDKIYGPDTLRAFNTPGDSIVYGPDTIFHNAAHSTINNSNLAPYMGLGTVDLEYEISGGLVSLKGGLNYLNQIKTYTWGIFTLTYYWCPASVLSKRPFSLPNGAVNPNPTGLVVYPNPVKSSVSLQFGRALNGRFTIDVLNASGQLLQQNMVKANGSLVRLELPQHITPGVYYLRVRDQNTNQHYLQKLLVQ